MANFFSIQDGDLSNISTYGYSLTGAEVMNNTTSTMLLTSSLYSAVNNSDGLTLSAIAIHLSARSVNPTGTLGLTLHRSTSSIILAESLNETYAISSFTSYDGSNNLLSPLPQNWQILKLSNPLSTNNGDVINYSLSTSSPNQLSLIVGAKVIVDPINVNRLLLNGNPILTSFKPNANFDDSIYLNATNWLTVSANSRFSLSADFTIEFWVNGAAGQTNDGAFHKTLFSIGASTNSNELVFSRFNGTTANDNFALRSNTTLLAGTIPICNSNWHHVAINRYNNILGLYVDGVRSVSASNSTVYSAGTGLPIAIGAFNNSANGRFLGYINQFRIVNGTAVYPTSSFTPPTSILQNIPNTVLLILNGIRYDQALITNNSTLPISADSIHIGGALKGLTTEPRTITARTSSFQNIYIHNQGTLTFPLTSSTTLNLNGSAGLQITSDGTLNIGTSSTFIPLSTTHTINLSNTQIDVHNGGNFNVYGFPETTTTSLVSTHPIGSRVFTVTSTVSNNWRVGDVLSFKPNLSARRSFDELILSSFIAPNVFTTTSNSLCTHTGSADQFTFIPDVYNLSRNVIIQGSSSINRGTIRTIDAGKTYLNYATLSNFGINSSNKTGLVIGNNSNGSVVLSGITINSDNTSTVNNIAPLTGRTLQNTTINNNIINRSNIVSLASLSVNNVSISNNYILSSGGTALNLTNLSGSINMSNNTTIGSLSYGTYIASNTLNGLYGANNYNSGLQGMMISGTNTGTIVGGGLNSARDGVYVDTSTSNLSGLAFQNIIANNNTSVGFKVSGNNLNYLTPLVLNINGLTASNNSGYGLESYNVTGNLSSLTINNNISGNIITSIGNGSTVFDGLTSVLSGNCVNVLTALNYGQTIIKNALLSSSSLTGIALNINVNKLEEFRLEGSILSATTPLRITSTRSKLEGSYIFHNSNSNAYNLSSLALTGYQTDAYKEGIIVMRENGLSGNHYKYTGAGSISFDKINVKSPNTVSERLTPWSTITNLRSTSKLIPVNIGDSLTISVILQRSSGYTGAAPRLILVGNASLGYYDSVLATSSQTSGWETITGTIPASLNIGVVEVYVDCSGNVGSGYINIDSWDLY